ncbi:MAG: Crp/Fnr family transcriptional regulator [Bacteroidales bacterium]|nr:Crp/Fnr family transcriptional regulator [Bacteroidales bacterium]
MDKIFEILSGSAIFQGIDPRQLELLFDDKLYRIKNLARDEYAVHANDLCNNLIFIIEGSVRGEMTDFSGKVIKIEDIGAPRPVAPAFVFGKKNSYPVDIIANEPTRLLILPKDSLIRLLQQDALILKNFLDAISNRAQFLSEKIRFLSFKTIKGKIAHYLIKLAGKENQKVFIPETQSQMADFFGVTRPSLARALGEMERDGILGFNKKEVVIKDIQKLREFIN